MAQSKEYAIPRGATVLVTAANGYITTHIIDLFLELGYRVRGTIRSEKPWLNTFFAEKYGKDNFETIIVPDLSVDNALDKAIKGVSAVVQVASDLNVFVEPKTVIARSVDYSINCLKAAAQEPSVKQFVLTSSTGAANMVGVTEPVVVHENSWNDESIEKAFDENTPNEKRPFFTYLASKTEAERESWRWVEANKPGFVFNTILPAVNLGAVIHPELSGSTMGHTRALLTGDQAVMHIFSGQNFIDVRDCARLHVAAVLDPSIKDQRIFGVAGPLSWTDVVNNLRKLRPENKSIPDPLPTDLRDPTIFAGKDKAEEILKSFWGTKGWTSMEDSLAAGIEGFE